MVRIIPLDLGLDQDQVTCYYRFMLTRRTNLLLAETDYLILAGISQQTGRTMGDLARSAIREKYGIDDIANQRRLVFKNIAALGKKVNTRNINYRDLINHGRKH